MATIDWKPHDKSKSYTIDASKFGIQLKDAQKAIEDLAMAMRLQYGENVLRRGKVAF